MLPDQLVYERGAVRPVVCLSEGWRLVKDAYWQFLGITFVGVLVGQMGPMGILFGPALCGIHLCLLRHERGLPVTFDMLFNGFHYFTQGLVATLIMLVPTLIAVTVLYLGMIAGLITIGVLMEQGRAGQDNSVLIGVLIGVLALVAVGFIVFELAVQALFLFAFPLIVDRELSGLEAIKLSYRAAIGNFKGLFGLMLVTLVLDLTGLAMCYIGAIFLLPVHFAMVTIAYRQVFPPAENIRLLPEPEAEPPDDSLPEPALDTGITAS